MTRLICRAVLATTAALVVIVLHGQTTTAGLLDLDDLDDLDDLAAAVLDDSTTQPDPAPTPITELLDRTTSIVRPIVDLGAVAQTLTQPLSTIPLPTIPLPVVTPPSGGPAPAPDIDTDIDIPLPPAVDPPIPGPDPLTGVPAPIDDVGGTPIAPIADPGDAVGPGPAPGPEPSVDAARPAITAPADVRVPATGDPDRGWRSYSPGRPAARSVPVAAGSTIAAPPSQGDAASPTIGATTADSHRSASASPASGSVDRGIGQPTLPVDESEAWNPIAGRRGGLPALALGVGVAAIAALSFVIAVVRRAISRRGQRADEAVDREREPTGRASAEPRPPGGYPRSGRRRTSGPRGGYPQAGRRRTPGQVGGNLDRASADARSIGWAVTEGCRGPLRHGPPARSPSRRREGGVSRARCAGGRRSITPPARRTTG